MSIECVILAAGLSTRANAFKMTLDIEGKTVIERCIETFYPLCSRINVVVGYRKELIIDRIKDIDKVNIVVNENYEEGMFSSVKEGFRAVNGERFFFTPGDYPLVSTETCKKMLKCSKDVVMPLYRGKKGHPILINKKIADEAITNSEYSNLRQVIREYEREIVDVNDKGILMDIDTYEDYVSALEL